MTKENRELQFVNIEAKGFQDLCNKLAELEAKNKELILEAHETVKELEEKIDELTIDNDFLQRQNNALKMRCSNYCLKVRDLESEIADMKFTRNCFGNMSPIDIAEEECIANGEAHYNKFAFIGDDF